MIRIKILSAEATVFSGTADAVFLPGEIGEFEVLAHHADIMSTLFEGDIKMRKGDTTDNIHIKSGIARVKDSAITACVEL